MVLIWKGNLTNHLRWKLFQSNLLTACKCSDVNFSLIVIMYWTDTVYSFCNVWGQWRWYWYKEFVLISWQYITKTAKGNWITICFFLKVRCLICRLIKTEVLYSGSDMKLFFSNVVSCRIACFWFNMIWYYDKLISDYKRLLQALILKFFALYVSLIRSAVLSWLTILTFDYYIFNLHHVSTKMMISFLSQVWKNLQFIKLQIVFKFICLKAVCIMYKIFLNLLCDYSLDLYKILNVQQV